MTMTAAIEDCVASRALWITAPRTAAIIEETISPDYQASPQRPVLVTTRYSAVSRGTERLVYQGLVPVSEHERMRAPFQAGDFTFPIKYGYANVGWVPPSPAARHAGLSERHVFGLYPHQTAFFADPASLIPVPLAIPPRRAVLAANMETALNACWDGGPLPGDSIAVVGCGLVGALLVYLCSRIPGVSVVAIETDPGKTATLRALGAVDIRQTADTGCHDLVFHTSATSAGLQTAISLAGPEARIIELSWYGNQSLTVDLGGRFHALRLQLRSSQVGTIAPARAARWTFRRRLMTALDLLADDRLDALLSPDIPFDSLPATMAAIFDDTVSAMPSPLFCQVVSYS